MPRRPAAEPHPRVIDTQHRVRLPADLMAALGLKTGDHAGFEIDGDETHMFRAVD